MMALKNLWRKGVGTAEVYRPPERDEHMVACDTLMSELDFHIKEIDRFKRDQEQEERRMKTGVDYSWLMESNPKIYEMPQMERLELEELCYKVTGPECTQIISLFRDAMSRDPRVEDLPYIMRSCVKKTLDERPSQESLAEWVAKRTPSLANFSALRLKPPGKVVPSSSAEAEDIEMQSNRGEERKSRAMSMPNFSVRDEGAAYPV
ncbi:protein RD3 [Aplysia californica]|uniref:Protein RD3 n=1 Tax=Aplysia californica TaxID=6500 RepID=A0ABM1A4K9_APLCA|nr:protein RD3 [Aplysia californica]